MPAAPWDRDKNARSVRRVGVVAQAHGEFLAFAPRDLVANEHRLRNSVYARVRFETPGPSQVVDICRRVTRIRRTARSRTSGESLFGLFLLMARILQNLEIRRNPRRFTPPLRSFRDKLRIASYKKTRGATCLTALGETEHPRCACIALFIGTDAMSTSLAINSTPMSGRNAAVGHAVDNTGNTNVAVGLADSMSPESPAAAFGAYIPDGKIALTKRAAAPVQDTGAAGWTSGADTAASGRRSLTVRLGDALWNIAGKLDIGGATRYQKMVAILNANPDAFTDNNINKLKAGWKPGWTSSAGPAFSPADFPSDSDGY